MVVAAVVRQKHVHDRAGHEHDDGGKKNREIQCAEGNHSKASLGRGWKAKTLRQRLSLRQSRGQAPLAERPLDATPLVLVALHLPAYTLLRFTLFPEEPANERPPLVCHDLTLVCCIVVRSIHKFARSIRASHLHQECSPHPSK